MGDAAVTERDPARNRRRLRLPRRLRVLAGGRTAEHREAQPISPTSYRTLSRKVPSSLTALGGTLALLGGLGTWARATQLSAEGVAPEQVRVVMGYSEPAGVAIAVVGGAALLSSVAWLTSRLLPKLLPLVLSGTIIGLVAWRIPVIDRTARVWVVDAREGALDFVSFHAGFGWGAWLMLVATIALGLGVFAGILRELDVRRGTPE
ncbi:MAG: hypothetical protein ACRDJJ_03515 [Actinomycetota bacterium]